MKKTFLTFLAFAVAIPLWAENIKFVTLLSQPVGTFSSVDVEDANATNAIYYLNFCNISAGGTMSVKSLSAHQLLMTSGGKLSSSNLGTVSSSRIDLYKTPATTLTGGRLDASSVTPSAAGVDVSAPQITLQGDVDFDDASFDNLSAGNFSFTESDDASSGTGDWSKVDGRDGYNCSGGCNLYLLHVGNLDSVCWDDEHRAGHRDPCCNGISNTRYTDSVCWYNYWGDFGAEKIKEVSNCTSSSNKCYSFETNPTCQSAVNRSTHSSSSDGECSAGDTCTVCTCSYNSEKEVYEKKTKTAHCVASENPGWTQN
ncbi:MAG: hypothetical protein J6U96_01015 [Elusimicrobiaceae bacterium]|nr:hypothetical protein [Elusimicrobiaceae bacterium]